MSEKNRFYRYLSVIASVMIILGGILSYRPVVDYQLSLFYKTGDEVFFDVRDLEIKAIMKNRGGVDAPVFLEIKLENAFFTDKNTEWNYFETDTLLRITTTIPARRQEDWDFKFLITPKEDKDNFNVLCKVKKRQSGDIITDIFNLFYSPKKWNPIFLEFERTGENGFTRID